MSKTFTFAGTCVENGAVVYKFANDANRAKALERFGCTEINMIALPNAMDKDAAIAYLATVGMTAIKPARGAKPKSASVKVKVKAAKDVKVVATKAKRIPAELKPGMDAAKFFDTWMADKAEKANAWREKNGI
jgi:hypothetical protein